MLAYRAWLDSSAECVACHGDREKLARLGYPELYVTPGMVEKESNHPNVTCRDCHLGNGRAKDPDEAHKGMLKAMFISEAGEVLNRAALYKKALVPTGSDHIREMLPKGPDGYVLPEVRNLLWQDRNPRTFNFDPAIAAKTCGKPDCHPQELAQFRTSIMGRNFRQRTMKTWLRPYGPHNCGPSFADLPATRELDSAGFDYSNTRKIMDEVNVPFSKAQAEDKQKFCNICHAGCLDCHYAPDRKLGAHRFVRRPLPESCGGYGRGTSICHPGAMQSRRGETYIGGDYSIPEGMKPDVHYKKGILCVDCHLQGPAGMGDMMRKATCQDCHIEAEDALARSVHRKLDCAACHITQLRGYQLTIWGPGYVAEKPNPFNKYSLYYGIQSPPIIMKDQKGQWMPVKIWPHSLSNFRKDVPSSPGIMFRWPDGQTRDAYYIVGTIDNTPSDNKHLLWLEIEQAAHPFGKARSCKSCHGGKSQVSVSTWQFMDNQGAEPFNGTHRIVADAKGLRIEGLHNTTPIKLLDGYKIGDFASWLYFRDKWKAPGDFSIKTDPAKYRRMLGLSDESAKGLERLQRESAGFDKEKMIRFKRLRETVLHDPEEAASAIKGFR
ncbi:MAG: cytochrome c3 family protein [Nitrospiraceae bacterium]|nr:cytochrome c3 family protein [Nitrospiraceae bacterium]